MKKTGKELDAIVGEWVEEHKQRRARVDAKGEPDFIDAMLSVLDGADLGGFDADTVNKATILADRVVSESDISKLVYLQAIVKETLRLYRAAPLSAPREFTEDCTIGGYHVWKGTRLITNLWKIQTYPRIWPDPFEFKPERFLTTHKDVDVKGLHFELIPFGSGRRACPGLAFGLQMVQLTLASFVHAFEISNPSSAPIDMTESSGLTNIKATPLQVLIKPRLPSQLYG
ncbi:unnamed protein product [Prunus armeniaca]